ncbi:MAG: helix-turn-helix transcriptional regulator [Clostridiaceae bacterium]
MVFENIARLCEASGITISGLELKLGFGNGTIHSWKTSSPSVAKLKLVADYLGVTVDELLKEDGKEHTA